MLLGGTYKFRTGVDQRVGLKRFQAWTPPAGFTFHGHWARAAAAFEATGAFGDLIEFHLVPVLDIMESVPISARVLGWIDSIG
jgi:hypothetical protein